MSQLRLGTRITLWSAVIVALGIVLFGIGTTAFLYHERVEELDRQLAAEARHFLDELKRHGGPAFDWQKNKTGPREWSPASNPPRRVEVVDNQEHELYRTEALPAGVLSGLKKGFYDLPLDGETLRVGVFHKDGITLRLVASYRPIHELTQHLVFAFVVALPVILAFVVLGGRWVAHKAVAPIQEIIGSAERITAQHLDQRLPVPPVEDEIHRLATVLNHTLDRLHQSFQQATRFTADASHELKTPITILRTSAEALLRSPELSEADQRAVAGILEQTKRLSSITASLLLLSRADVGKLSLDLAPGNLAEIVEMCIDDAQIMAEEQEIRIESELPPKAPALVDRTRAAQVVMNVLDNALKYNRRSGGVRVTLRQEAEHWALEISNTGPEISAEVAAQLFTRFYRGEHTAAIGGHGLGLSLSRELARAHGGDLVFAGSEEGWSTFVLKIPAGKARLA